MEKYNGNRKGFIYVSCGAREQNETFDKYLEPLAQDGVSFWWADGDSGSGSTGGGLSKKEEKTLARAKAVLLFLTKDYAKDKKLRDTVAAAVKCNKPVLCVYLEDVELDAALSMQTEAQQALFVSGYGSDEEFVKELKKAAIFDSLEASEEQNRMGRPQGRLVDSRSNSGKAAERKNYRKAGAGKVDKVYSQMMLMSA